MRLDTHLISETPPDNEIEPTSGPVACAVIMAVLAVGVIGGALWLTSAVIHSNAEAAAMILSYK
jgi:hypothetical protein